MEKDKTEYVSTSDKIAGFIQKNRKLLLALLVLLAAGIIGSISFFLIRGALEKKAIAAVEALELKKNEMGTINTKSEEVTELLNKINALASSSFGYAAVRAYSMAADIHFSLSEWEKAEENWVQAANKMPKMYLAPLSLFNAAVAAEEQGKLDAAIDYYNRSLEFSGVFPADARARFNIGRIMEVQRNKTGAAEAYRSLIEKNPDSNWAKLAQSRIITFEME